jgi:conjugative transfer region protein TrbK
MRAPSIAAAARSIGCAAMAAAIIAAALHFRPDPKPHDPAGAAAAGSADRLARELARCQALGMAAKDDAACAAAWAETRRRFFTYGSTGASAKPGPPQ